ncbi:MAG TPA: hypothetical protein VJ860_05525 [Polyangia bacterium]|nr:hypothetical protein [Polyangia bacterium]
MGLERDALMAIAAEACHAHRAFTVAKTTVDRLSAQTPAAALAPVVGQTTAAGVFTEVGDARSFLCTRAFLKAMGLNLKEGGTRRAGFDDTGMPHIVAVQRILNDLDLGGPVARGSHAARDAARVGCIAIRKPV